jgi:hypothetical protein
MQTANLSLALTLSVCFCRPQISFKRLEKAKLEANNFKSTDKQIPILANSRNVLPTTS